MQGHGKEERALPSSSCPQPPLRISTRETGINGWHVFVGEKKGEIAIRSGASYLSHRGWGRYEEHGVTIKLDSINTTSEDSKQ